MRFKNKLLSFLSVIATALTVCSVNVGAASPETSFATGDNSTILIIAFIGIGAAALVIVLLTLFGNKKNKK